MRVINVYVLSTVVISVCFFYVFYLPLCRMNVRVHYVHTLSRAESL